MPLPVYSCNLKGLQLPILTHMYEVSGSKPRTASDRGLVENLIEALVIDLTIEIIRPLLLHALEVNASADQSQQFNQRRPCHCLCPQVRYVL